mmetsp:Transcript_38390/g.46863  ORF Transcript_38390/g.46863 Transcript_38390/m.46863 type:complete len:178 (+) Transcript_38390:42-575(+)
MRSTKTLAIPILILVTMSSFLLLPLCQSFSLQMSLETKSLPTCTTKSSPFSTRSTIRPRNPSRRSLFTSAAAAALLPFLSPPAAVLAADGGNSAPATVWISGKSPKVPGAKPKDKSDVTGTKKDPSFLRSVSDCRNQCESTYGPDGYARSKEDCLSDCQDICCKTYEQCTFNIIPRM